jgi:hypothetical protein
MTNAIIEAVKTGIEAAGGMPWQVQAGMVAGGVIVGVLGSVGAWIGKQFWNKRRTKTKPEFDIER